MKKFVSSQEINEVFLDMDQVDYVTVLMVTDSMVSLVIHLNSSEIPDEKEAQEFKDRAFVLGRMLDRKVVIQFKLAGVIGTIQNKVQKRFSKKA